MRLRLHRFYKGELYTIGKLYINDEYLCDTIEDVVRELNSIEDKVYCETAIPSGTYKIILNVSPKFKRLLPRLLDVPFFEGILIHKGNTAEHSCGCIIVGENKVKGKVINSTHYEKKLVELLKDEKDIEITVE
ncbi:DUF5675 family protein [Bacteroides sp. 51]|uniref:DUF5675 family protein n=1 Tax=Bacteroides sp. 51 TaxID=2302938 RepID=UPI00351BA912